MQGHGSVSGVPVQGCPRQGNFVVWCYERIAGDRTVPVKMFETHGFNGYLRVERHMEVYSDAPQELNRQEDFGLGV